jgi:hypothetical protein
MQNNRRNLETKVRNFILFENLNELYANTPQLGTRVTIVNYTYIDYDLSYPLNIPNNANDAKSDKDQRNFTTQGLLIHPSQPNILNPHSIKPHSSTIVSHHYKSHKYSLQSAWYRFQGRLLGNGVYACGSYIPNWKPKLFPSTPA